MQDSEDGMSGTGFGQINLFSRTPTLGARMFHGLFTSTACLPPYPHLVTLLRVFLYFTAPITVNFELRL